MKKSLLILALAGTLFGGALENIQKKYPDFDEYNYNNILSSLEVANKMQKIDSKSSQASILGYANGTSVVLASKYGNLQSVVTNVGMKTGEIRRDLDWSKLTYNIYNYIFSSKNKYEYYLKVHKIISLWNNDFNKSIAVADVILKNGGGKSVDELLSLGNSKVKQNYFRQYVIFGSQYLGDLSNQEVVEKMQRKYGANWEKMKFIIDEIEKEEKTK